MVSFMVDSFNVKKNKTGRTWFIDLDGTIFEHNSYLYGKNIILNEAKNFLNEIPSEDCLIFVTARPQKYKTMTLKSLKLLDINYDGIIFNISSGTRVIINDKKFSGKFTALAINKERNDQKFPFFLFNKFRFNSLRNFFKNLIYNYKYH